LTDNFELIPEGWQTPVSIWLHFFDFRSV
jgi:hypothetical protein